MPKKRKQYPLEYRRRWSSWRVRAVRRRRWRVSSSRRRRRSAAGSGRPMSTRGVATTGRRRAIATSRTRTLSGDRAALPGDQAAAFAGCRARGAAACAALQPPRALSRLNRYLSRVCEGAHPRERPVRRHPALHRFPPRRGPTRMKTSGLERIGVAALGQPAKRPPLSRPAQLVSRALRPHGHGRRLPNGRRRADPLAAAINRHHDGRQPMEGVGPTARALHRHSKPLRTHRRFPPRPSGPSAGHRAEQPMPIGS